MVSFDCHQTRLEVLVGSDIVRLHGLGRHRTAGTRVLRALQADMRHWNRAGMECTV